MAQPATWEVSGEYMETCSCDFLCPCIPTSMKARPTKGACTVALAFHVERGRHGGVSLDGLNFVVVARTPGPMIEGRWSVGVIVDERGTPEQREAIGAIASGQAGGPMAALAPLLGSFLGTEARPIRFEKNGMRYAVTVPGLIDQALEGVRGDPKRAEAIAIDNTIHPANARLALATATRSHVHAFGLDWDDTTGKNNGHFAPFTWRG